MSAITLNGATSGQVTLQPPAIAGTTTLTLPTSNGTVINTAGGQTISGTTTLGTMSATNAQVTQGLASATYLSPFASGYRNRIINGSMGIAQRGTSFTNTNGYTVDRWAVYSAGTGPSVAQVAGPTGYRYALQITGAAGNTQTQINQRIESYNCSDLSGQTVTIQVNISVSSAQTVAWYLAYPSAQDNYSSSTNITNGTFSATTTATTFTATITGLPSGVTNGLQLNFFPQNGGAFTSGTITITGVQLELGSVATPFEVRSLSVEAVLCQRYYETGVGNIGGYTSGGIGNYFHLGWKVTKRTAPTVTYAVGATANVGTYNIENADTWGADWYCIGSAAGGFYWQGTWTASAEL